MTHSIAATSGKTKFEHIYTPIRFRVIPVNWSDREPTVILLPETPTEQPNPVNSAGLDDREPVINVAPDAGIRLVA